VRAFRASVRNEEYAKDAEEKRLAREKEETAKKEQSRKNPFTVGPCIGVGTYIGKWLIAFVDA
jgi:pre-rRNA-processing protein TSR4